MELVLETPGELLGVPFALFVRLVKGEVQALRPPLPPTDEEAEAEDFLVGVTMPEDETELDLDTGGKSWLRGTGTGIADGAEELSRIRGVGDKPPASIGSG